MNLKELFVNWLFKGVVLKILHTRGLHVMGGKTLYVDIWDWDHNTSDPSLTESLVWYNSTDATMKYRTDSETVEF